MNSFFSIESWLYSTLTFLQEIEGVQYDIRITGDPVVFNGEKFVRGEELSLKEVISQTIVWFERIQVKNLFLFVSIANQISVLLG